MFQWTKWDHGCNCSPMPENAEKYKLNLGRLYGGVVETTHDNLYDKDDIGWEASVLVCGRKVTGRGGGGMTRDDGMKWVEEHILEFISSIILAASDNKAGQREIYDSLMERDPETGKFNSKRLE